MADPQFPEAHINGAVAPIPPPLAENVGTKRQRRPSVRLGDIGDQTFDSVPNRKPKQWKGPRVRNPANYKTLDGEERELEGNLVPGWRVGDSKPKTKRVRSNWTFSKGEHGDDVGEDNEEEEEHDNSPIQSLENRASKDFEGGPSDTDTRNWNVGGERNGIRVWLNQLGLGRYAPVFEIHEVDDEVLPLLTLEDLKDMGINAVGSRRKMYCAIQKLNRGFS